MKAIKTKKRHLPPVDKHLTHLVLSGYSDSGYFSDIRRFQIFFLQPEAQNFSTPSEAPCHLPRPPHTAPHWPPPPHPQTSAAPRPHAPRPWPHDPRPTGSCGEWEWRAAPLCSGLLPVERLRPKGRPCLCGWGVTQVSDYFFGGCVDILATFLTPLDTTRPKTQFKKNRAKQSREGKKPEEKKPHFLL
jgi:hypothetical protein